MMHFMLNIAQLHFKYFSYLEMYFLKPGKERETTLDLPHILG